MTKGVQADTRLSTVADEQRRIARQFLEHLVARLAMLRCGLDPDPEHPAVLYARLAPSLLEVARPHMPTVVALSDTLLADHPDPERLDGVPTPEEVVAGTVRFIQRGPAEVIPFPSRGRRALR